MYLKSYPCIRLTTGKQDELQQLLGEVITVHLVSLMGENWTQQKQRQEEREQKRMEQKRQGLSDEEIAKLEAEEDVQAEDAALKGSTGNALQDLEVCRFTPKPFPLLFNKGPAACVTGGFWCN